MIAIYLLLTGLAWSWCRPSLPNETANPFIRGIVALAFCLSVGMLLNLLIAWFLLELGYFNPYTLTGALLAISAIGFLKKDRSSPYLPKGMLPALGLFGLLYVLVMASPARSEWLAGGWDPGVYMNQGLYAAQSGGWHPPPLPAFADLSESAYNPFTRSIAGRDELFPGIPLDPDTGALQLTFYPLTPTWIALLYVLDGPQATFQAMLLLALILAFLLLGGLLQAGVSSATAFLATVLVMFHWLLIYHTGPTSSELLETVFVVMLLLAMSGRETRYSPVFLALILLAGLLNRPTFLIWSALLFPMLAMRREVRWSTYGILSVPVIIGIAYYFTIGSAALDRVTHLFPRLAFAALAMIPLSFAGGLFLLRWTWRNATPLLFTLMPFAVLGIMLATNPDAVSELRHNLIKLMPYLGWPLILLGAFGIFYRLHIVWRSRQVSAIDAWLLLCLCVSIVPFVFKFVADLYPWATKRFLSSVPLLIGCGAAYALTTTAQTKKSWTWIPLIAGLIFIYWGHGARLNQALQAREYQGLFAQLQQISDGLEDEDLVVADHFIWATPLAMAFQHQVLNGEPLWARPSPIRTSAALQFLHDQRAQGRRTLLLTSTTDGTGVFPDAFHEATLLYEFPAYTYGTVAHHRNGTGFPIREHTKVFRLYLLRDTP